MRHILMLLFGLALGSPAVACGKDTDCALGDRHYRIYVPPSGAPLEGGLIFAHGYRGTARGVMRNKSLLRLADALNVALIAPKSARGDWALAGAPGGSKGDGGGELAYFDALLADVEARFALSGRDIVVAGFSAGGMMVWTLACHRGDRFAGFIPYAGTFWRPAQPDHCDSPAANVVHVHGTRDETVPLTGRPIQDTHQGDVWHTARMYARHGGFEPAGEVTDDGLSCRMSGNDDGLIFNLCLFDGGHSFRTKYVRKALDMIGETALRSQ